jgi:hypothetical protein
MSVQDHVLRFQDDDKTERKLEYKGRAIVEVCQLKQALPISIPQYLQRDPKGEIEEMTADYTRREILIKSKKVGHIRVPMENVLYYRAIKFMDANK